MRVVGENFHPTKFKIPRRIPENLPAEQGMTKQKVRFNVSLSINEGKLQEFEAIARTMIAGTEKEAGALSYDWYFGNDGKSCRLVETYADADAMLSHMMGPVVQNLVPKLLGVSSLAGFEVYGEPGTSATEMLKGVGAEIFQYWSGLKR
jgi:quinol monooxygenase YgiN